MDDARLARALWRVLEPVHAVVYFAPDVKTAFEGLGLSGLWRGYFASRAAPMGQVPPEVVIATFYNFHPDMVRWAMTDTWERTDPAAVTAARLRLADRTLRRWLGDETLASPAVAEAATVARRVAEVASPLGRPLFAGYTTRQWPDDEWDAAIERLRRRGWLRDDASLSAAGASAKQRVEDRTDQLAAPPLAVLHDAERRRLLDVLDGLSRAIADGGEIRFPNPIGLPDPREQPEG